MPTDVVMPQMGESITEGTLTKWLKKTGDTVARDEPLFEISTDKVDAEIPSPAAGTLGEIKVQEGATVTVGTVVCAIEEAGSSAPAPAVTPKEETVTPAAVATAAKDQAVPAPIPEAVTGSGTEVLMPQMGESITEGTLTKWLKKVGDSVARDEPIFEISTDKVDAEIPSPIAGTLTEIRVKEGETVTVSSVVAVIGGGAGAPASTPQPQSRRHPALPRQHQLRSRQLPPAKLHVPRPWSARSPPRTTSISRRFLVPEPLAASPSKTSWAISKAHPQQLLSQLPLRRPLLLPLPSKHPSRPSQRQLLENSFRSARCAASSPSAWSSPRPPVRMSTPSSR